MDIHQEVERLSQIPMFSKVETCKLKLLAFTSKLVNYNAGEMLFFADDPPDSVYLVLTGEVEILSDSDAGSAIIRGENALIGEMAVISGQRRSAAVRAKNDVTVLRIEGDVFLQLLTGSPDVALDVMRQLNHKLLEAHQANEQLHAQLNTRH